jgi:anaerobic magnesium-protoporphyrin IX monomethyl ester cyclase
MTDIVICILPKIDPDAPTVGPAILKSHLESEGFSTTVLDFNIELYRYLERFNKHNHYYFDDDFLFSSDTELVNDEFHSFFATYSRIFYKWIAVLRRINPKYIGLSLLSRYSQSVAIKLSELIRRYLPDTIIVWGGAQVANGTSVIKENNLCDYYILGDGEFTIVELLKQNYTAPGINSETFAQVDDFDTVMMPNYDDIKWDLYQDLNEHKPVYITGSRGCVKRCTFCSVPYLWPEYKFRSGKSIANEIIHIKQKYDRKTFKFTDSLINGSMKSFRDLLDTLIEYRATDDDWHWISQWIIRSPRQSPEEDYKKMKASGCIMLDVGVESFSQSVRWHLGKKFTDEEMWFCFDMLKKYQIQYTMLLITGYPTETKEDHLHTLAVIERLFAEGYARDPESGMKLITFNFTPMLLGDPLLDMIEKGLEYFNNERDWKYKENDTASRIRNYKEVLSLVETLHNEKSSWGQTKYMNLYTQNLKNG